MKINIKTISKNKLYELFQTQPLSISEKELAFCFEQSRFDARLFEIITEHIRDFWWAIDPIYLNKYCKKIKSPFVILCIINAIITYCKIRKIDKHSFSSWIELTCRGISKPRLQFFILSGYKINGAEQNSQIQNGLDCFKKCNVYFSDLPFNKGQAGELKSQTNPPLYRLDKVDLLKQEIVLKVKQISHHMNNAKIIKNIKINRVFLSNILNSKTKNISLDYMLRLEF